MGTLNAYRKSTPLPEQPHIVRSGLAECLGLAEVAFALSRAPSARKTRMAETIPHDSE